MNLEVVRAGPTDVEEWSNVVSWVYQREAANPETYPLEPGETRYLVRSSGKAVAACTCYSFDVARGESALKCGGIAGVATLPEHRREGAADALMNTVLRGMREDGYAISALYAFRSTYYRKFGYENCGWRWQIKCPADRLPKLRGTLPVRQINESELTSLDSVYVPFIRARSGSPLRTAEDWKHRMGKKTPMVYAIGDPMQAYLWVNLEEFWGEASIGEIAWTSREGYETGLSLIRGLCSNQLTAVWNEPPDSPFVERYMDQGITATHHRPTMFRVVDVEQALRSFQYSGKAGFCFELVDEVCDWNSGVWTVACENGAADVRRGGKPSFSVNVRVFSQALMGQPSLEQLADQGLVDVSDREEFEQACDSLTSRPVVCMEFF